MPSKILVTGGAGFIGSNLVDTLLGKGFEVICLDNFSTGHRNNLETAFRDPKFKIVEGDIRSLDDCKKAVQGCHVVFHQAALGSVPRSIADPVTTNDVNVGGFVNMLFAAKTEGVKRVVYASSSSVYGDHPGLPKTEEITGKALSPYAISKQANELYAINFSEIYGLETIGLRYFNVFGRRQDPKGPYAAVIPKFATSFIYEKSPVVNGNGSHSRDFTYIDNVIDMNLLAMETQTPEALNTVYNVACGQKTTILELATTIKAVLSKGNPQLEKIEITHGPIREGDIPHSLASIEKARNLLGYNPRFNFCKGIAKAIEWYCLKGKSMEGGEEPIGM